MRDSCRFHIPCTFWTFSSKVLPFAVSSRMYRFATLFMNSSFIVGNIEQRNCLVKDYRKTSCNPRKMNKWKKMTTSPTTPFVARNQPKKSTLAPQMSTYHYELLMTPRYELHLRHEAGSDVELNACPLCRPQSTCLSSDLRVLTITFLSCSPCSRISLSQYHHHSL